MRLCVSKVCFLFDLILEKLGWKQQTNHIECKYFFIVASLRNFGERASNLFSRKKKSTEQNAQSLATEIDQDVNKAASSVRDDVATGTG